MTYYETQQQNPMHNSQFNPQQWAAFNSQAAQPYSGWPSAPWMQAIGGYGLGGYGLSQAACGQQYGQYGGQDAWGQQRQLTQQAVADVTRQLIGVIPQMIGNLQAFNQQRMF